MSVYILHKFCNNKIVYTNFKNCCKHTYNEYQCHKTHIIQPALKHSPEKAILLFTLIINNCIRSAYY